MIFPSLSLSLTLPPSLRLPPPSSLHLLSIYVDVYGPESDDVAKVTNNFATLLEEMGEKTEVHTDTQKHPFLAIPRTLLLYNPLHYCAVCRTVLPLIPIPP